MFRYTSQIPFITLLLYLMSTPTGGTVSPSPSSTLPSNSVQPTSFPHSSVVMPQSMSTNTTDITNTIPTQIPTAVTRLFSCTCDVTLYTCDANCCCDVDCSEETRTRVFACSISGDTALPQSCIRTDSVYLFNSLGTLRDGVLCVQINNNPSATHYTPPNIISDSVGIDSALDSYGPKFSYPQSYVPPSHPEFYRLGDPICALYSHNTTQFPSFFYLPQGVSSHACTAYTPVAFYKSLSSVCTQQLDSVESGCAKGSAVDASLLTQLLILKLPICYTRSVYNYTGLTHGIQMVCTDSNSHLTACPVSLTPVYNRTRNSCYPVLKRIDYTIATNGTDGISSISAVIQLIQLSSRTLEQSYNVKFSSVTDKQPQISLSGNPGYLDSYPVVVASLHSPGTNSTQLFPQSLTILQSLPVCDATKRSIIGFDENTNSGCEYSVNLLSLTTRCSELQDETRSLLIGNNYTYLGVFGNSISFPNSDNSGLWMQSIYEELAVSPTVNSGCKLYTQLNIQILFASNGTFYKPDRSIRGLRYRLYYTSVDSSCIGYVCSFHENVSNGPNKKLFLTTSVEFRDISDPPQVRKRITPGTTNILPDDFFYPFFVSAATVVKLQTFLTILLVVIQYVLIVL